MTRAENVAAAQALRDAGLSVSAIAVRMGAARSTVSMWLSDPDLSKQWARRDRYRGRCVDCDAPTDGSSGRVVDAPTRCDPCSREHKHATRRWTREAIVSELRLWAAELGRAPTAREGFRAGAPVCTSVVQHEFGSWNVGIAAAGFTPRGRGERISPQTKVAA
jgi:hypothetical protein